MGPCVDFRVDSGSGFAERDEPGGVRRLRRRGYNPSTLGGDGGTEWWSLQRQVDMKIRPHLAMPERAGSITRRFQRSAGYQISRSSVSGWRRCSAGGKTQGGLRRPP